MTVEEFLTDLSARISASGKSLEQIAEALGVSPDDLDRLLNHKTSKPQFSTLLRVLERTNHQIERAEVKSPHGLLRHIDQFRAARPDKMTKKRLNTLAQTNRENYFANLKNPTCDPELRTLDSLADAAGCPLKIIRRELIPGQESATGERKLQDLLAALGLTNRSSEDVGAPTPAAGPTVAKRIAPPAPPAQPPFIATDGNRRFQPRYSTGTPEEAYRRAEESYRQVEEDFKRVLGAPLRSPASSAPASAPARSPATDVSKNSPRPQPNDNSERKGPATAQPASPAAPSSVPAQSPLVDALKNPPPLSFNHDKGQHERTTNAQPFGAAVPSLPANLPARSEPARTTPEPYFSGGSGGSPPSDPDPGEDDPHTIRNVACYVGTAIVFGAVGTALIRSQPKDRGKLQLITGLTGGLTFGSGFGSLAGPVSSNTIKGAGTGFAIAALVDKVRALLRERHE